MLFFALLLCLVSQSFGASFFGASHISVPVQEARSSTEITLRFKTSKSDALILLAAGKIDYCLLLLQDGALKVRINLGSGETELSTPRGLKLDDLTWHDVKLDRQQGDLVLTVDKIHTTKIRLEGRFYELNIHYGVFVGGLGDFREIFLGLLENFRGCLDDVMYNGIDVISRARHRTQHADVHAVTWDCSPEFDAVPGVDVSFLETNSLMALPMTLPRQGGVIKFSLKTQSKSGTVFYASGASSKGDFIVCEIVDNHLRVAMDSGGGLIDIASDQPISNSFWHDISVKVTPSGLEMSIDDGSALRRQNSNQPLDLSGNLFIGGIDISKQTKALNQGVKTANESFQGCLGKLEVEGRPLGFREARITQNLAPDCIWEYPCISDPCVSGASCVQEGTHSFQCLCDTPPCVKTDFASNTFRVYVKHSGMQDLEILNLSPLQVAEGGSTLVTTAQLDVVFDYQKYGIRDSGVIFHIVKPAMNGRLVSELWRRQDQTTFTLLDLHNDKIRYFHDGSETVQDTVIMELELVTKNGYLLPSYFQARQRFVLHATITPVNDPPELNIPTGRVFRIALNTKKPLTNEILNATDPDTAPSGLEYTVLSLGSSSDATLNQVGYIENVRNPGVSIESFTQEDLNSGSVYYVNKGAVTSRLALRITDGIETGTATVLRISAFELHVYIANNTGISVVVNGSALLTSKNLTCQTNAVDQDFDIKFDIVKAPIHGSVQRLKNDNRWQTVTHFTLRQMESEKIRYLHTTGNPESDQFQFTVTVLDANYKSANIYDFRILFTSASIVPTHNEELLLNSVSEGAITESALSYRVEPQSHESIDLKFTLLSEPKHGDLLLTESKSVRLQRGEAFKQSSLVQGRLKYKLLKKTLSAFEDSFMFAVSAPGLKEESGSYVVRYLPPPSAVNIITQEVLEVNEGATAPLTPKQLSISYARSAILYNITSPPRHGHLSVKDEALNVLVRTNATYFTSDEISEERVLYTHDDSETTDDSFMYVAGPVAVVSSDHDFQYIGRFRIKVQLRNDNAPVRSVDKVFHVVTNGEKLLTASDLAFFDPDVDTRPEQIVYTRRGIPNGSLYKVDNLDTQLFQFTQAELNDGRILFRHHGPPAGTVALWVTDGQFYTTGNLEIRASDPFVSILNNTGIVVKKNGSGIISGKNLTIATNLNVKPEEVVYEVLDGPVENLEIDSTKVYSFTQEDLDRGRLSYRDDVSWKNRDRFAFRVGARGAYADGEFVIRIFSESYWEPLKIGNNRTLLVQEGTSVKISQNILNTFHPNVLPSDITYFVRGAALNGYLEIESDDYEEDFRKYPLDVTIFDQSMVNDGKLRFIETGVNQTDDRIVFDVSNGIYTLSNLQLNIEIIPKTIYLTSRVLQVREGGKYVLTPEDVSAVTAYYADKITEFLILEPPKSGSVRTLPIHESVPLVRSFTPKQLNDSRIVYIHDGSENLNDNFVVIARADGLESLPVRVDVSVTGVDDEPPVYAGPREILVWESGTTILGKQHISATDVDSSPSKIRYSVIPPGPACGYLALQSRPKNQLSSFTQAQVDSGEIVFEHTTNAPCHLLFSVTDGQARPFQQSVDIKSRHLHVTLLRNNLLHVFPMMQQSITVQHLLAATNDGSTARTLQYVVTRRPRLGRLLLETEDAATIPVSNFTQSHLNESLIIYEHSESFNDVSVRDSFEFMVLSDGAETVANQEFFIEISVTTMSSGGFEKYLVLKPVQVEEGAAVKVTKEALNVAALLSFINNHRGTQQQLPFYLKVVITNLPKHGFLTLDRSQVDRNSVITSEQIERGSVVYHHDHSDTLSDTLGFSIYLEKDKKSDSLLYNGSVKFIILPINDQPFTLVTTSPKLEVVQGQSSIVSRDTLVTEDPDSGPDQLIYDVITSPGSGRLTFSENLSIPVLRFTQEDVNRNRVLYTNDGTLNSTQFYFKVSDGKFEPQLKVFNIIINKLTLTLVNQSDITLKQGSTVSAITNQTLGAMTNGQRKYIFFNITREPAHGRIFLRDSPISTFGQINVDKLEVFYLQTNLSASLDSLEIVPWTREVTHDPVVYHVKVSPLVKVTTVDVLIGERVQLSLQNIDSSELAVVSKSNPTYRVVRKPKFGKIRKTVPESRTRRQVRDKETLIFTHEDVRNGFIYYVPKRTEIHQTLKDSIEFQLSARNVQPAIGSLEFILSAGKLNQSASTAYDTGNYRIDQFRTAFVDYMLIGGVAVGVLLLFVTIIIVVRCRGTQKGEKQKTEGDPKVQKALVPPQYDSLTRSGAKPRRSTLVESAYGTYQRSPTHAVREEFREESISDDEMSMLPPLPPPRMDPPASPYPSRALTRSMTGSLTRGSWQDPPSLPAVKVIPLMSPPQYFGDPPNVRYPYGMPDEDISEDWNGSIVGSDDSRFTVAEPNKAI